MSFSPTYFYVYGASRNLMSQSTWKNSNTDTKANFNLSITVYKNNVSAGERRLDVNSTGFKSLTSAVSTNGIDKVIIKHNGSTRDLAIATIENLDVPANSAVTLSFTCNGYDPTTVDGIDLTGLMLASGSKAFPYQIYNTNGWQPFFLNKYVSNAWTTANVYKQG